MNIETLRQLCRVLACSALLSGCGIASYPGQPGVKTNGNARLDYEVLDDEGLWIYEVNYDNSSSGQGVESITTRLFPRVFTYSSNARSNSDGTYYRHKLPYRGSRIQMISFPKEKKVYLPQDSKVLLMLDFVDSVDEIDDRNLSEEGIFERPMFKQTKVAYQNIVTRLKLLKSAELTSDGALSFEVDKITLNQEEYNFSENPVLQSNITQSGINVRMSIEEKLRFKSWIEERFPKGFDGEVTAWINGESKFSRYMKVNTIETLANKGFNVIYKNNMNSDLPLTK